MSNSLPCECNKDEIGTEMFRLISGCYPICRSITGNGVRETLKKMREVIPLEKHEVPTGTQVFDWIIPEEWNIKQAYIKDPRGKKILDFNDLNLHVLNYSSPVAKRIPLEELQKHIFTIPEQPDLVPYRTSYYQRNWGFCMSHKQLMGLEDGMYEVLIDSSFTEGSLTYGEYFLPGRKKDEVLISTHICHPSLCNDNLSGLAVSAFLARCLGKLSLKYSYRFVFVPATIGSIAWLSLNENKVHRIKHGLVITLLGDSSAFTYKRSRRGDAEIDKVAEHYLEYSGKSHSVIDFMPYGYDERQYCSPGFNLPVGCLTRTLHAEFPEYHTSADNLDFIAPENLAESLTTLLDLVFVLENNHIYVNQNPKCEPMLGKRGLYQKIGGRNDSREAQLAALWVLNMSDGSNSLLNIADRSGMPFKIIKHAADALLECGLLQQINIE
jgi:aminopeptidase-like protein